MKSTAGFWPIHTLSCHFWWLGRRPFCNILRCLSVIWALLVKHIQLVLLIEGMTVIEGLTTRLPCGSCLYWSSHPGTTTITWMTCSFLTFSLIKDRACQRFHFIICASCCQSVRLIVNMLLIRNWWRLLTLVHWHLRAIHKIISTYNLANIYLLLVVKTATATSRANLPQVWTITLTILPPGIRISLLCSCTADWHFWSLMNNCGVVIWTASMFLWLHQYIWRLRIAVASLLAVILATRVRGILFIIDNVELQKRVLGISISRGHLSIWDPIILALIKAFANSRSFDFLIQRVPDTAFAIRGHAGRKT